jgi:predicted anti-sigma-YlaC factor YlaD
MKHKQFEEWILDEPVLTAEQKNELRDHLKTCPECRQLNLNWQASKQLLLQAPIKSPSTGFTTRWQTTFERKHRTEKALRYRLTLLGLLMLAFAGSLVYMIASGVFLQMLSITFTGVIQLMVSITHGLSGVGILLRSLPAFVPVTLAFALFGLFNAFFLAGTFTLWNLKYRKLHPNESPIK